MSSEQTPRVNSALLERFVGQNVRLVGKVIQLRGESATLDSNGNVVVHMTSVCTLFLFPVPEEGKEKREN